MLTESPSMNDNSPQRFEHVILGTSCERRARLHPRFPGT